MRRGACESGRCAHRLCCNPAHIVIRTPQEHADASAAWGDRKKLTAEDVSQIKARLAAGERGVDIAKLYGISGQLVSHIKVGRRKSHI